MIIQDIIYIFYASLLHLVGKAKLSLVVIISFVVRIHDIGKKWTKMKLYLTQNYMNKQY
jgi:hypothetical protein